MFYDNHLHLRLLSYNIPVIIFCGGTGTNIRGFFEPKACIPVNGMPLLYHIIKKYLESGFTKFILPVGLGAEKISDLVSKDNLRRLKS